jgi:hypothetical protein
LDPLATYIPYSHSELVKIFKKIHRSDHERAHQFAARILEIPIFTFFLSEEDLLQFLNAWTKDNPLDHMGELLSTAFKNQ